MKHAIVIVLLACAACAVQGRELQQVKYNFVADALSDKNSQLSTLLAAVKAAGIEIPADKAWTIFAPTNKAFNDDDIKEKTGLTAKQLLEPANKAALTQVLQYHVVPSAALRASQLRNGQQLTTALAGASPLRVEFDKDDKYIEISEADVLTADIGAGKAIIHVIDEVLIPPSLVRKSARDNKP